MRIVGPRWSGRSHELRDLLARNNVSHGFYDVAKPEGRRQAGRREAGDHPIALLFDGRVLVDPPNEAIAEALGVQTEPASSRYDLAVVGGGPAGLTAAMYAASEGLTTLLLEREAVGGQAGTTSLIRNYLGFPVASAVASCVACSGTGAGNGRGDGVHPGPPSGSRRGEDLLLTWETKARP